MILKILALKKTPMLFCSSTPEYYNISEWDEQGHLSTAGMAEFVLSKHYNQNTLGSICLRWEAGKFSDLEKNYSQTKMVCGKLV